MTAPHRTTPQRLFLEWDELRRRPATRRRIARWDLPGPGTDDLDEVLRRAGYAGDRRSEVSDQYLHRLLTMAAHDELAARVVLQRILPGLVVTARRRGRIEPGGPTRSFDELVASAWLVIRTFPVERRTRRIAANLLQDVEYQTFVQRRRLRSCSEVVSHELHRAPSDELDPARAVVDDPRRQLDELLQQASARGVARADVELLRTLGAGVEVDTVAEGLGISDRAVRARRAKAVERVRAAVVEAQTAPVTASYPASSTAANTAA